VDPVDERSSSRSPATRRVLAGYVRLNPVVPSGAERFVTVFTTRDPQSAGRSRFPIPGNVAFLYFA
jgi:hypothetical protein